MPVDPQAQAILDELEAKGFGSRTKVTPQAARKIKAIPSAPGPQVARVEDRRIPGPEGDITLRVYTPPGDGPFPILVWIHGGGWVIGSLEAADATSRRLALGANCVVASVDYRLAPEAKFPAAAEDCYAATAWVARNASDIGGDGRRIAVGGGSAGGNLAAVVPLMARDRGGPGITFQVLVYPATDRSLSTRSMEENASGYGLTRDDMAWYWEHYLKDEADASNPYAVPMLAKDLVGLPPALVITAEFDPLRDEGEAYARRLQEAGVPTTYTCDAGMIHIFFNLPDLLDKGAEAVSQTTAALKEAFGSR